MWLLSTNRAELHHFLSPQSIPARYAILSHVWDSNEQSFQATESLRIKCMTSYQSPRDFSSAKVQHSCMVAQANGYDWMWNDTCCIDQKSSAELSEGINSMRKFYANADICYAYLNDVPPRSACQDETTFMAAFRTSRWFQRGWTLQELIFPRNLLFLNREWQIIGSKADLAHIIEQITAIPVKVLRFETELQSVSVAARMSWAADRHTTRPEDEAYCLVGLFFITMCVRYGEGRYRAFQRLQEEIMQRCADTTLFAWGSRWLTSEVAATPAESASTSFSMHERYLFAPAPSAFRDCGGLLHIMPVPPTPDKSHLLAILKRFHGGPKSAKKSHYGVPTFSITPYGIRAHLPLVKCAGQTVAILSWFCDGMALGLLLSPSSEWHDPTVPRFKVGARHRSVWATSYGVSPRLIALGQANDVLQPFRATAIVKWRDVYIEHCAPPGREVES